MKSVAGTYGAKKGGNTVRAVLLENGGFEMYKSDKRADDGEAEWKLVNGGIHIVLKYGEIGVWRTNEDGSLTVIAGIEKDGNDKNYKIAYESGLELPGTNLVWSSVAHFLINFLLKTHQLPVAWAFSQSSLSGQIMKTIEKNKKTKKSKPIPKNIEKLPRKTNNTKKKQRC